MTVRRRRPLDEATLLGLLMKGDFAEFARVTGSTVQQVERMTSSTMKRMRMRPELALLPSEGGRPFLGEGALAFQVVR